MSELTTIQKHIEEAKKRKYILFSAASSEVNEIWFADTLREVNWKCRDEGYVNEFGSLKKIRDGVYRFGNIEIYELKKHPKLIEEMRTWE